MYVYIYDMCISFTKKRCKKLPPHFGLQHAMLLYQTSRSLMAGKLQHPHIVIVVGSCRHGQGNHLPATSARFKALLLSDLRGATYLNLKSKDFQNRHENRRSIFSDYLNAVKNTPKVRDPYLNGPQLASNWFYHHLVPKIVITKLVCLIHKLLAQ